VVESLDSALARIDPIDLVWLFGGVVLAAFMLAVLVSLAATAVRNRRTTILKTSPPLVPLQPSQRRRQHEREDGERNDGPPAGHHGHF
jgi:hypothetical protein